MTILWNKITDIPIEVFIHRILPFCDAKDVLSLGCTNKFFALVANDETFWRRKVAVDHDFTRSGTTQTRGWKFPYHKLNPRVFVWGCVVSSFSDVMRVFIRSLMHPRVYSPDRNHSDARSTANLGHQVFHRRPGQVFPFQSNFAFQVFAWPA